MLIGPLSFLEKKSIWTIIGCKLISNKTTFLTSICSDFNVLDNPPPVYMRGLNHLFFFNRGFFLVNRFSPLIKSSANVTADALLRGKTPEWLRMRGGV